MIQARFQNWTQFRVQFWDVPRAEQSQGGESPLRIPGIALTCVWDFGPVPPLQPVRILLDGELFKPGDVPVV